jgi:starch synthase (maltosyl-transferring)
VLTTPDEAPILSTAPAVEAATNAPRIAIEAITPAVDGGRFPVKRRVGEWVDVEVDLISDGHESLAGLLLWRAEDATDWHGAPLRLINNDRWTARFQLTRLGRYVFTIEAWRDEFGTFQADLRKKPASGGDGDGPAGRAAGPGDGRGRAAGQSPALPGALCADGDGGRRARRRRVRQLV